MKTPIKQFKDTSKVQGTNSNLYKFYIDQLKDILWSERALIRTMRILARNAGSPNLISIIKDSSAIAEEQVVRLEKIFAIIGKRARGKKCEAMEGLIGECENILENTQAGPVRDAGIIASFQKFLHFKIPAYRTLCAYCSIIDKNSIALLLEQTLAEDKRTDNLLSEAAYNTINFDAAFDENKILASHYNRRFKL